MVTVLAMSSPDPDNLRKTAFRIRLRKLLVNATLLAIPALILGFSGEVFALLRALPNDGIVVEQWYIVALIAVAFLWLLIPLLYFQYIWDYRLDIATRSNESRARTSALQRVVDIYNESQKYSIRALLFGLVGIVLTSKIISEETVGIWPSSALAALTFGLLVLAILYQKWRIGPYLIDNILFVCIRSERSTMSHQEALDQLTEQGSPQFRKERPDLYY